ncbi:LLM class flavin-dependent oxidoreductase [Bacillus cereus group sp. N31]|uniref:LLM class flavin-dependent oxidoreductase n=1 Tax=Bacillus cereus group sp. N31 TaxID=2794594 RepID=UPI0018F31979|nr:LLM class flavin-dependent oxidoreductase [Bacillus cereus group sp. N31]MBJ7930793.1 LLM class flavin-dependent oxidoreductase [Bacillus cereus group sp. N31]
MTYNFEAYLDMPANINKKIKLDHIINKVKLIDFFELNGSLVYYKHDALDPWILADKILHLSNKHTPIIALQPYTMEPITAAKMIYTITQLHNRKVNINMISGGLHKDLEKSGNELSREERYKRICEYSYLLKAFLSSNDPITFRGDFYNYRKINIYSELKTNLIPHIFISENNMSEVGLQAAAKYGDIFLTNPLPVTDFRREVMKCSKFIPNEFGIRLGIVTRPDGTDAKLDAKKNKDLNFRYREILKYQMYNSYGKDQVYYPISNEYGDCPLLVGSYKEVSNYLKEYWDIGVKTIILSQLNNEEDIKHVSTILQKLKDNKSQKPHIKRR